MPKFATISTAVSILVLAGTVPLQAAILLPSQSWELAQRPDDPTQPQDAEEGCPSWNPFCRDKNPGGGSAIWDIFRRRRVPGGSRGSGRDLKKVCAVTPGALSDPVLDETTTFNVWSDRPLFFWQDSWGRIEVQDVRTGRVVWSQTLDPEQRSIVYSETAAPLRPRRSYYWRLFSDDATSGNPPRIIFRTMNPQKRDRIAEELANLEGETVEETANARAEYFAAQELWSDALRELYTVENPSDELLETLQDIQAIDFCEDSDR